MELCIQLGAKKEGIKDLLAVLIDDFQLEPQQTNVKPTNLNKPMFLSLSHSTKEFVSGSVGRIIREPDTMESLSTFILKWLY